MVAVDEEGGEVEEEDEVVEGAAMETIKVWRVPSVNSTA